ncbi:MAG: hypothetical protein WKF41_13040 [Gaiellaceae bacterium]
MEELAVVAPILHGVADDRVRQVVEPECVLASITLATVFDLVPQQAGQSRQLDRIVFVPILERRDPVDGGVVRGLVELRLRRDDLAVVL